MNHILFNPGPTNVNQEVYDSLYVRNMCHRDSEFKNVLKEVRNKLRDILNGGSEYDVILFVSSGTGANEAIISSTHGKILAISHGRYSERMIEIAQGYQIPTVVYKLSDLEILDVDELEKIIRNDNEFTHLMLVHHETTTGMLEPLKQICSMARRYNLITIVDTISSIGAHPFNLEELGIDFCTLSANKAAEGLPGISFVIARKIELMKLKGKSRTYYFDLFAHWQAQENNNSIFTSAISTVFSFNKALDRWIKEGYNERVQRYKCLWKYMRCGLENLDLELIDIPRQHSYIINLIKIPLYMNYELVNVTIQFILIKKA